MVSCRYSLVAMKPAINEGRRALAYVYKCNSGIITRPILNYFKITQLFEAKYFRF